MNAKIEVENQGRFDGLKWFVVFAVVAAGAYGNYFYQSESLLYRVIALLALGLVAGYVALTTIKGQKFWTLVKDAKVEVRKVVWPTKQETVQTTIIVVAVVILMGIVLWLIDWALNSIINYLIG